MTHSTAVSSTRWVLVPLVVAFVGLAACSNPGAGSVSSTDASGTGNRVTGWINLSAREYVVEGTAGRPAGCVESMNLVGTNGYPVVGVIRPGGNVIGRRPNDPPPTPMRPDQVLGWRANLVAGQYRFEVKAPEGCLWTAKIHPPAPGTVPEAAVPAHCADLGKTGVGQFVTITGRRVPLPVDNPLAGDPQVVQPKGDTIEHYAVGIDDGSAICTVLWAENQPLLGADISFTGEILQRNGRIYLGVVLP